MVASRDESALVEILSRHGYVLRRLDGANIHSARDPWSASARQLGHAVPNGWDGYANYLAQAILPDDDEGDKVALLWRNADQANKTTPETPAFVTEFGDGVGFLRVDPSGGMGASSVPRGGAERTLGLKRRARASRGFDTGTEATP